MLFGSSGVGTLRVSAFKEGWFGVDPLVTKHLGFSQMDENVHLSVWVVSVQGVYVTHWQVKREPICAGLLTEFPYGTPYIQLRVT